MTLQLLFLNETINTVLILKDKLKCIGHGHGQEKLLMSGDSSQKSSLHPDVNKFANMLQKYSCGTLNYCNYQTHTSKLEGVNNKIKVIKKKYTGFWPNDILPLKLYKLLQTNGDKNHKYLNLKPIAIMITLIKLENSIQSGLK